MLFELFVVQKFREIYFRTLDRLRKYIDNENFQIYGTPKFGCRVECSNELIPAVDILARTTDEFDKACCWRKKAIK